MKRFILSCSLLLVASLAWTQVDIQPNPIVVEEVDPDAFEAIGYGTVINATSEAINYTWTRTVVEMTEGWESAVCDKNQCYLPSVSSMDFILLPEEDTLLDVHVYPNNIEGQAIIEVTVTDQDDPANTVTARYYFNSEPTNTLEVQRDRFRVYPNPNSGLFSITGADNVASVQVYNLAGKLVSNFDTTLDNQYDIRKLPRGSYLVQLIGDNNGIVATKLIQKL